MSDDAAQARHALTNAMLEVNENLAPILDAAAGVKADLERRGWSPTAAETVATQWLVGAMSKIWSA